MINNDMSYTKIKEKLLKTTYFIDNEFLDLYCSLIYSNLNTNKVRCKTQKHHILPKCYFKLLDEEIDNSSNNLVNLLFVDHLLAHFYLYKCTSGELKIFMAFAVIKMSGNPHHLNIDLKDSYAYILYQREYEQMCKCLVQYIIDKDDLYNYYIVEKHTLKETAQHFGCSSNTIVLNIQYYNIYKINKCARTSISKEELYQRYIIDNESRDSICKDLKISSTSFKNLCKKYAICKNNFCNITKEQLINYYITQKHSPEETAKYFNVSRVKIDSLIKRYDLRKNVRCDYIFYKLDFMEVLEVFKRLKSIKATADYYGIDRGRFYYAFRKEMKNYENIII